MTFKHPTSIWQRRVSEYVCDLMCVTMFAQGVRICVWSQVMYLWRTRDIQTPYIYLDTYGIRIRVWSHDMYRRCVTFGHPTSIWVYRVSKYACDLMSCVYGKHVKFRPYIRWWTIPWFIQCTHRGFFWRDFGDFEFGCDFEGFLLHSFSSFESAHFLDDLEKGVCVCVRVCVQWHMARQYVT